MQSRQTDPVRNVMGLISRASSQYPRPISPTELLNVLSSLWQVSTRSHQHQHGPLGLAISGGVDSMALAALCSHLQSPSNHETRKFCGLHGILSFNAFVVDHGVRRGSDREAQDVSEILERRGIKTKILTIDWKGHNRPAQEPNFESLARRARFRAIGHACKDLGVQSLLLAHHEDDQAETVLMRLARGHRGMGLSGIRSQAGIPECYGLHGISESGNLDLPAMDELNMEGLSHGSLKRSIRPRTEWATETGGIRIYRPLLSFPKERLIATCQAEEMPWFDDATNKDLMLTPRNAIRHIFSSYALPPALSKSRLIGLASSIQRRRETLLEIADGYLAGTGMTPIDTYSGSLKIRLPDLSRPLTHEAEHSVAEASKAEIAALILRRIIMSVTPREDVPLSSLHLAVDKLFPETRGHDNPRPTTYTIGEVQFKPLSLPSPVQSPLESATKGLLRLEKPEWLVSRQPHDTHTMRTYSITYRSRAAGSGEPSWSPWTLYDGRFWIRLRNVSSRTLRIRPFRRTDMNPFKQSLTPRDRVRLEGLLMQRAPGDVRWTLPVIVGDGDGLTPAGEGDGRVLVLPTLDFGPEGVARLVGWDVRYKKIDVCFRK